MGTRSGTHGLTRPKPRMSQCRTLSQCWHRRVHACPDSSRPATRRRLDPRIEANIFRPMDRVPTQPALILCTVMGLFKIEQTRLV